MDYVELPPLTKEEIMMKLVTEYENYLRGFDPTELDYIFKGGYFTMHEAKKDLDKPLDEHEIA